MIYNFYLLDINFEFILLFFIIYLLYTKNKTYIQFLINFELGWIVLYVLTILISIKYNLLILLAFIFFILVFSSIELAIGFLIINFHYKLYDNICTNNKYNPLNIVNTNFFV